MAIFDTQYNPAVRNSSAKYEITKLDTTDATDGQVIAYSSSAGVPVWGAAVASGLTDGHIFVGDGSDIAQDVALSGDATLDNTGALTIANSAITTAKIAANAVDGTKIALASQAAGDIMYYNGTDWVRLAKGTDGDVLTLVSGVPAWVTP